MMHRGVGPECRHSHGIALFSLAEKKHGDDVYKLAMEKDYSPLLEQ